MHAGNQVVITITINVPVGHIMTLDPHVDGVISPFIALAVHILVPIDVSIEEGRRRHIQVPVMIEVHRSNAQDEICIVENDSLGELACPVIAPKRDPIIPIGGDNQVLVTVLVEIYGNK